jgi:Salmonella virulence plasmid 65kDa B protein
MHSSFTTRLVSTICFLIFTFTVYCIPHLEVFSPYKLNVFFTEAQAAEAQEENQAEPQEKNQTEAPDTTETPPAPETLTTSVATSEAGDEMGVGLGINIPLLENSLFTGASTSKIPIVVPPGRGAMTPNIYLMYNSRQGAGWVGVGWNLDMGAIQRSTKWGLNYGVNDFVAVMNGSYNELIQRSDWGTNYFGSKIEGAFSKYYLNPTTGGWEVTAKDGTKYYYGTTSNTIQDNAFGIFKWCLDKAQDTNGNYLTLTYWKDQGQGEIYLDRIDYTGNGGLLPTNYVKFNSGKSGPPMDT